jgi:hypothetical protein
VAVGQSRYRLNALLGRFGSLSNTIQPDGFHAHRSMVSVRSSIDALPIPEQLIVQR